MEILVLIIVIVFVIVPLFNKGKNKAGGFMKKKGLHVKTVRSPQDYGNITLDNKLISQRGKGVLDPSSLYSESKLKKEQARR